MPATSLVILNPKAAGGKTGALLPRLQAWLKQHQTQAQLVSTEAKGHAQSLAALAAQQGIGRVVVVGGDGSLQEVVNGLMQQPANARCSLGLVSAGRGNDAARGLGLPRLLPDALACAFGSAQRRIDVLLAQDAQGRQRYFTVAGGAGFDAQVAHVMEQPRRFWMRGEAGYLLATLRELWHFKTQELLITLRTGDSEQQVQAPHLFAAFANSPFYGAGMQICPGARCDDGLIDVCMVGDLSRLAALRALPGIYKGSHLSNPKVSMAQVRSLRIESRSAVPMHLDGEPFGTLPVDVCVVPKALTLACVEPLDSA